MTVMQAAAILVLWRSSRFDTMQIAELLGLSEPNIVRVLDEVRRRERGPELQLVRS